MAYANPPALITDARRAGIEIKEQIERSEDMRHFFHNRYSCVKVQLMAYAAKDAIVVKV
jgi:hypothetical protein